MSGGMEVNLTPGQAADGFPPASARTSIAALIERTIMAVTCPVAAALVVVIAVTLFSGVVARYVFGSPISWADELAAILFLWLVMLGSVVALGRNEHMRLTLVVGMVGTGTRTVLEALSVLTMSALLILLFPPAVHYVDSEWMITTPALELPDGLRVLGLAVGIGLMLMICLARMLAAANLRQLAIAFVIVAGLAVALMFGKPALMSLGKYNLVVFFVLGVGATVLAGVPIGFAFGIATAAYLTSTTSMPLEVMVGRIDEGVSHIILLSIPMFVLLGLVMESSGLARALIGFMASLVGHVRGGLHYVLLGAMYLVSGISGSKAADMAAVAPMLFPEMEKRGLPRKDLVALLSASGAQTETIPPSFVLIILGSVTGVSIAALFTAGLLPAVVAGAALAVVCAFRARGDNLSGVKRPSPRDIGKAFVYSLPALALPFIIRAAVVEGVATATEVSTIGVIYALLVGAVVYRKFDWRGFYPMLVQTAALSGSILIILGMATAMAWALTQSGFSRDLAAVMTNLPGGAIGFMAVSVVLFVVLGSLLEGIPAIVLFGPLLFPIAKTLGIHEVHYAIVAVLAMGVGLFTPPFGVGFYAACAIGRESPDNVMGAVWPYIAAVTAALVIVAAIPWISIGFL
ncbi:tripartite ATP-independent transporter DctM subunit [Azospirillum baldaniorum]|nr:tripartite ATP-independent transporter DctM subunit [Azospirillum baldaniorum]